MNLLGSMEYYELAIYACSDIFVYVHAWIINFNFQLYSKLADKNLSRKCPIYLESLKK